MNAIMFALPGNEQMAGDLAGLLGIELGRTEIRRFPDGESYLRIDSEVRDRTVILLCSLDRPDEKFLQLRFLAATARDLGAQAVGLVCPYLAYMRQDTRFHPGEVLSSAHFARYLSDSVDWLVTVDPHLHRRHSLAEIFSVPAAVVHAAPRISAWIRENVPAPILIGPDSESEQWVTEVADGAKAPYVVLEKVRRGDRDVEVSLPAHADYPGRTPVLLDDIISTARTMIAATLRLKQANLPPPVCIGVHAIFAGDAFAELTRAGAQRIVTCNTICHPSNGIDVTALIAEEIRKLTG